MLIGFGALRSGNDRSGKGHGVKSFGIDGKPGFLFKCVDNRKLPALYPFPARNIFVLLRRRFGAERESVKFSVIQLIDWVDSSLLDMTFLRIMLTLHDSTKTQTKTRGALDLLDDYHGHESLREKLGFAVYMNGKKIDIYEEDET